MLQCSQPSQMPAGAYVQDGFPQQRGWPDRKLRNWSGAWRRSDFRAAAFPNPRWSHL